MILHARMYVRIVNAQGEFVSIGQPFSITAGKLKVGGYDINDSTGVPTIGLLSYPSLDVRAFRIYVYRGEDNSVQGITPSSRNATWRYLEFQGVPSQRANLCYAKTPGQLVASDFANAATQTTAALETQSNPMNNDPNRVLVSEAYKPRALFGRNALYIGNSANDKVVTFGSNAKAISQGQFGQYPLYAFCRSSIWAMEVGEGNVAFKRVSPVSINEGIVGKKAIVNVDGTIVYATLDGIKTMPPMDAPLSFEIQGSEHANDILRHIDENTVLGYLNDKLTGRKELWVSTDTCVYAYSFTMKRWFMLSGTRELFIDVSGVLVGAQVDGILYKEAGASGKRTGKFELAPLHLGEPDMLKRFRRVLLRTDVDAAHPNGYAVIVLSKTEYDLDISGENVTGALYGIDCDAEVRYEHRPRIRRTWIDLGFYAGYGNDVNPYAEGE